MKFARSRAMKLMQEYSLEHVRDGLTTLEEVQRVVPFAPLHTISCVSCGRELSPAFLFCPHCGTERNPAKTMKARRSNLVIQGVEGE